MAALLPCCCPCSRKTRPIVRTPWCRARDHWYTKCLQRGDHPGRPSTGVFLRIGSRGSDHAARHRPAGPDHAATGREAAGLVSTLSTHVLDAVAGAPAGGVPVVLD